MNRTEMKTVYIFDESGVLASEKILTWQNRNRLNGTWIIPSNATAIKPPEPKDGFERCYINGRWIYKAIEKTKEELKTEKIAVLDGEYEVAKKELSLAYIDAVMNNDEDMQTSLKEDLAALNEMYDSKLIELESE